jgi:hypothetical protein
VYESNGNQLVAHDPLATNDQQPANDPSSTEIGQQITVAAYDKICRAIRDQPQWRGDSNTDADYYDGAQMKAETIARLKAAGIPAQDSNLIKPTINAVLGLEARSRTDYKVTSDDEAQSEMAEGLSAKIKEIETESRADRAMSDAYSSMIRTGLGWVEVSREYDRTRYPYRVREIHRNDIYWDWTAREPDLSDARYLRRDRWIDRQQAMLMFPDQMALIQNAWAGWNSVDVYSGEDTGMARAYEVEQTWGHHQEEFMNHNSGMVKLSELWYRYQEEAAVLLLPNGQSIEYNEQNPIHQQAVMQGVVQIERAMMPRLRYSIWLGPHKFMDEPTPFPHGDFPYIPFWCFRKDRSRTPYGLVRDMRGPQDQIIDLDILLYEILNSVKVEIDNDALDLSQNTYKEVAQNIQSLRSITVLNANRRNQQGFKVTREHQLATQVFQLVQERKKTIEDVGGVYRAMLGASTQASSGVAINNLVEQGSTVLAEPNDNFRYGRRLVGQQILSFIVADMVGKPQQVAVQEGAKKKMVYFNQRDERGVIRNDIATAAVKVVLEDIPATPTFRAQQLASFTELVQSAPPEYQAVLYPAMVELSDVPNRHQLADQLRQVAGLGGPSPEMMQMQQQMQQMQQEGQAIIGELQQELEKAQKQLGDKSEDYALKHKDLEIKAQKNDMDARLEAERIAHQHVESAQGHAQAMAKPKQAAKAAPG